jgi:hypothetical protein
MATNSIAGCPVCHSTHVRPSPLTAKDVILLIALMRPVQCRHCNLRFHCWIWERLRATSTVNFQP